MRNSILSSLKPTDFDHIRPLLKPVSLQERLLLEEPSKTVAHVDFIESGVVSLLTLAGGSILETAIVGRHGFVGFSTVLGMPGPVHRSVVLVSGNALRIGVDDLHRVLAQCPSLRQSLLQYVRALMIHGAQTALCGVRHPLEGRLASWICLACEALGRTTLPITHDYLSTILGLRRPGVTQTLARFEARGLVRKSRSLLQVVDREELQRKACCCYNIISSAYKVQCVAHP